MALQVREKPRLALSINATTPGGQSRRWGSDEPSPANVPADLSFSTSAPGGFESLTCTLPRKPELVYADLERFSTLTVRGPGGEVAWEGRLEGSPRVAGTDSAVSPQAVGWQAHLEDDQNARMVYVDRDLGGWGPISRARRLNAVSLGNTIFDPQVAADATNGIPALVLSAGDSAAGAFGDALYDTGVGLTTASVYYDFEANANVNPANANWSWGIVASSTDDSTGTTYTTGDLSTASTGAGIFTPSLPTRYLNPFFRFSAALGGGTAYEVHFRYLIVWGNHGLTKRGSTPDDGLWASDVITHAVQTWAPLLNVTSDSVTTTSFVIPQLAFKDPVTAAAIIQAANRYHLNDWAVWEDKTFYYHERGARGRNWRARVGPAKLTETGPSIENLWNGVIVRYQDVDGTTKTVGPTGSGADTESTDCEDSDPLNPANVLGINRWTQLDMGGVSTPAGAQEVGRRFLIEAAQYNASGQAQLEGHVEDDRGIIRPAWQVRAGDTISFVDAADASPRRIVKTNYSHASRTCSVDLDAPPDGIAALLERMQIVLSPLGLS